MNWLFNWSAFATTLSFTLPLSFAFTTQPSFRISATRRLPSTRVLIRFALNFLGQVHIIRHQCNTLRVYHAHIRILIETDEESLHAFLKSQYHFALPETVRHADNHTILTYFTNNTLKCQFMDQELYMFLVVCNLLEGSGAWFSSVVALVWIMRNFRHHSLVRLVLPFVYIQPTSVPAAAEDIFFPAGFEYFTLGYQEDLISPFFLMVCLV